MSEQHFFNLSIPFEDRKEEILNVINDYSIDDLYKKFAKKQKLNLRNEGDYPIYENQIYSITQNIFKCKNCEGTLFNPCHHLQNQNNIYLLKNFLLNLKNKFDKIQFDVHENSENDNLSNLGKKRNGDNIFNQNNDKINNGLLTRVLTKENFVKNYLNSKSVLFEIGTNNKNYNLSFNFVVLKSAPLISVKLIICSKYEFKSCEKLELKLYHQGEKKWVSLKKNYNDKTIEEILEYFDLQSENSFKLIYDFEDFKY